MLSSITLKSSILSPPFRYAYATMRVRLALLLVDVVDDVLLHLLHVLGATHAPVDATLLALALRDGVAELARSPHVHVIEALDDVFHAHVLYLPFVFVSPPARNTTWPAGSLLWKAGPQLGGIGGVLPGWFPYVTPT